MQRHKSQVQDLMTENPYVVEPETVLFDAYTLMFEKEIRYENRNTTFTPNHN